MTVRELNGWSPASVTYSPEGVVLSVTVTEPRFTVDEKARLLASRRSEAAPRGPHGRLIAEVTDPDNQFAYSVPPPVTDWAQKKLNEEQERYKKKYPNVDTTALLWRLEKLSVKE